MRDLLIKKGVDASKIVAYKGFGASKPVADNATEEEKEKTEEQNF